MGLFSSRNRGNSDPATDGRTAAASDSSETTDASGARTESRPTRSIASGADASGSTSGTGTTETGAGSGGRTDAKQTGTNSRGEGEKDMATIGQSIVFKGELTGDEDLEIEGQVDGNVELSNHQLTVGANGRLRAEVNAKSIIVIGQVIGNLTATERIEIQATGVVEGDLKAPRLNVQEGAVLNGAIDMSSPASGAAKKPAAPTQPAASSEEPQGERKSA